MLSSWGRTKHQTNKLNGFNPCAGRCECANSPRVLNSFRSRSLANQTHDHRDWGWTPCKKQQNHIDVSHSRQPLIKAERLVSCNQMREPWQFIITSVARTFKTGSSCRFQRNERTALNRVIRSLTSMPPHSSSSSSSLSSFPAEYFGPEPEPEPEPDSWAQKSINQISVYIYICIYVQYLLMVWLICLFTFPCGSFGVAPTSWSQNTCRI